MKNTSKLSVVIIILCVAGAACLLSGCGTEQAERETAIEPGHAASTDEGMEESRIGLSDGVIVYYFHGDVRCNTCRTIEALSQKAVETGFPESVEGDGLEWNVINVEREENEHFVEDYQIFTSSLIIQKVKDGHPGEWKNLEKVWDLVGNEPEFVEYVQHEIKTLMGTS